MIIEQQFEHYIQTIDQIYKDKLEFEKLNEYINSEYPLIKKKIDKDPEALDLQEEIYNLINKEEVFSEVGLLTT